MSSSEDATGQMEQSHRTSETSHRTFATVPPDTHVHLSITDQSWDQSDDQSLSAVGPTPTGSTELVPWATESENDIIEILDEPDELVTCFSEAARAAGANPTIQARWTTDMQTLLKTHSLDEIKAVIRFAWTDQFWAGKVKSPALLSKHFDQLNVRARMDAMSTNEFRAKQTLAIVTDIWAQENDPWAAGDDGWGTTTASATSTALRLCIECTTRQPENTMRRDPDGWICTECQQKIGA